MASQPKGNERKRRKIAGKILANELLSEAEWAWLARNSTYHLDVYEYAPLTAEAAEKGREARRQKALDRKALKDQAYEEAYKDILKTLLKKAGDLKDGVLTKALEELQAVEPNEKLLRLGVAVAKDVADRNMGKATQRFEGRMEHQVSVLDELHASGALSAPIDAELIEDAELLELESGDDAA